MKPIDILYPPSYYRGHGYGADPRRLAMYRQERDRIYHYTRQGRILDVGCGVGAFLACFDDRWEKWGIEPSTYGATEAGRRGINTIREKDIPPNCGFWNVVVFRGTIQHIPNPFECLEMAHGWLRPGGLLALLATPNSNSPHYRLFKTLPALDPPRNWLIPSDLMLTNVLHNLRFTVMEIGFPYLGTPYARPVRDHLRYFLGWLSGGRQGGGFPFWRSMMEIYANNLG
jgi:SAM-dependent methyltransferase